MVLQRSMLNWRGVNLPWVYVHCAISAKFCVVVFKASMLNCRGAICHGYMCIVLYMKLIWCNSFAEIYAQLEEGETYVVLWFCRDLLNWRRGSI